jgi:hypothetical protein
MIELVQPICDAIHQLEADRPLLSQMLPVWQKLLCHAHAFDAKYGLTGAAGVYRAFWRRFQLHFDNCWAAAYALDPANAVKDADGEWCFPLDSMPVGPVVDGQAVVLVGATDVRDCVAELASGDVDAVQAELHSLEFGPLPALMQDSLPYMSSREQLASGKVKLVPTSQRRKFWTRKAAPTFPLAAKAAVKLLSWHVTSCASERNWSLWGNIYVKARNRLGLERATKLVAIRGNSKQGTVMEAEDEEVLLTLLADP